MNKKFIIFLLVISFCQAYSQNSKIYISENKLNCIFLLKNNTFGFHEYLNESPYSSNINNNYRKGYILNSSGSGTYKILNDSIFLNFKERSSVIDSINIISTINNSNKDSINIKFNNIYNHKKSGMPEVIVRDKIGNLIYGIYEYNNNLRKHISGFPLELIINDEEKIILETAKDYEINIFVNCFRNHNVIFDEPKIFTINKLTLIEEE